MAYVTKSITARIDWCRRQSTQACVPLESAGWRAEAEGLEDALLHRDHTNQYQQQGPPSVFREVRDGASRWARLDSHWSSEETGDERSLERKRRSRESHRVRRADLMWSIGFRVRSMAGSGPRQWALSVATGWSLSGHHTVSCHWSPLAP